MARLPRYVSYFEEGIKTHQEHITQLQTAVTDLTKQNTELQATIAALSSKLSMIEKLDNKLIDIQHKLTSVRSTAATTPTPEVTVNNTVADNHEFDNFYKKFEDTFRGDEALIKSLLSEHLPLFNALSPKVRKKPILDIGCGRGELLSLLKENGYAGIGVDMNQEMVERATSLGFTAVYSDAATYLHSQKKEAFAAITGFHIVEHIPFEILIRIFSECYRALDRNGFVLFETPNPRSLSVGANTFYIDPSHIRPVPSELLSFMLEYVGFTTEVVPLHEINPLKSPTGPQQNKELHSAVFGFADYAVIGRKA